MGRIILAIMLALAVGVSVVGCKKEVDVEQAAPEAPAVPEVQAEKRPRDVAEEAAEAAKEAEAEVEEKVEGSAPKESEPE